MLFKNHKSYVQKIRKPIKQSTKTVILYFNIKLMVMLFLPQIAEKGATIC